MNIVITAAYRNVTIGIRIFPVFVCEVVDAVIQPLS
jgi:hypothetical protein